jgi:hypothetical protein
MEVTISTHTYSAQRVILTSSKQLPGVLDTLEKELNKENAGASVLKLITSANNKEELEDGVGILTEAKRDFL